MHRILDGIGNCVRLLGAIQRDLSRVVTRQAGIQEEVSLVVAGQASMQEAVQRIEDQLDLLVIGPPDTTLDFNYYVTEQDLSR